MRQRQQAHLRILAGALGAFLALIAPALRGEDDAEAIRQRARRVVSRGGYQSNLDAEKVEEVGRRTARPPPPAPISFPTGGGAVGFVGWALLYTILGVLALLLAIAIVRMLRDRSWSRAVETASPAGAASRAVPLGAPEDDLPLAEALAEADRLAAAGRWDEAVHRLLLEAIRRLSAEAGRPRRSSTSRELVGIFPLGEERRSAFHELVMAVERAVFAGRPADGATYGACRGALEALAARAAA